MKKSQRWLFRSLSVLVCALLVVGASGLSSSLAVAAPVAAPVAVPAAAPVTSLPASPNTLLPNSSVQPAQQPLVTEPVSSTVPGANTVDTTAGGLLLPLQPEACTNPSQYAAFGRKDEIVAVNRGGSPQYRQPNRTWGNWLNFPGGNITDDPAVIARNRMLEYVVNKAGTLYYGRIRPDTMSLNAETSLGTTPDGSAWFNPVLVERTPREMWTFIRANNTNKLYYKIWTATDNDGINGNWSAWQAIPNVTDAYSPPAVVWRDPNHLAVFYLDSANNVKFIEMAFGEWMLAAIDLGKQLSQAETGLSAISMNANQVAVFGINSTGLWVRQWTADKQPDWSDAAPWTAIYTGSNMLIHRPTVASLSGQHMAVAFFTTNAATSAKLYEYNGSSWSQTGNIDDELATGARRTLLLAKSDANTLMFGGFLSTTGTPKVWTKNASGWSASTSPASGLTSPKGGNLVAWEPGEVTVVGWQSGNGSVRAVAYTAYGHNQTWQSLSASFTPAQPSPATRNTSALAKKAGTPYLVWLEKGDTGSWSLKSRANPATSSTDVATPVNTNANGSAALTVKDVTGEGNDEVVALYKNDGTSTAYWLSVRDAQSGNEFSHTYISDFRTDGGFGVAAGDLDGDGISNEIAVAYFTSNSNLKVRVFRYGNSGLVEIASKDDSSYGGTPYDVSLAINHFEDSAKDVLIVGVRDASYDQIHTWLTAYRLTGSALTGTRWDSDNPYFRVYAMSVDVEAVDLNGDGVKEVAAYHWIANPSTAPNGDRKLALFTLTGATFTRRSWIDSFPGNKIEVGDLEGDGREEIVTADSSGVTVYKQQPDAALGTLSKVFQDTGTSLGANGDFLVGDVNNDAVTLVGDGCQDFRDVKPLFVLNMPPRWYPTQGAGVSYAKSTSAGTSTGSTTSQKVGGSVTVGVKVEAPIGGVAEVQATVTRDFSDVWAQSHEDAQTDTWTTTYQNDSGGETDNPGSTGMVVFEQTKYRCYFFRTPGEAGGAHSARACAQLGVGTTGKPVVSKASFEQWNSTAFKNATGPSWAPIGAPTNAMTGTNGYLNKRSIPSANFPIVRSFPQSGAVLEDIFPSATTLQWDNTRDSTTGTSHDWEENTTVAIEAVIGNVVAGASATFGEGGGSSSSTTEGSGQTYAANLYGYLPSVCQANNVPCQDVTIRPYVYLNTVTDRGGNTYTVHELDYYVDQVLGTSGQAASKPARSHAPQAAPLTPIITSTTHADPNTWYSTNTVTLNWAQPANDYAVISGYGWGLFPNPGNVPASFTDTPTQTVTFNNVDEGTNFFTLLAKNTEGQLSPVAERQVLVDTQPPTVTFNLNPLTTINGWYNQPVTVTVEAGDGVGSGVASIEYSENGTTWVPYSGYMTYSTSTPTTTLWARATDSLGHIGEPVSVTFKLDLDKPNSVDRDGHGLSYGRIIPNDVGNFELLLGGQLTETGSIQSGPAALMISTDEIPYYRAVDDVNKEFLMLPGNELSTTETSLAWIHYMDYSAHGSYDILGYGVDVAGNHETPYKLGTFYWPPTGTPDFAQTLITSDDDGAVAGQIVTFTLAVRNSGTEDCSLIMTNTVPAGLTVLPGSISGNGQYVAASHAIVWRNGTAWPGETRYLNFSAQVDASLLTTTTLHNTLLLHPYIPQVPEYPFANPAEQVITGTLEVLPPAPQHLGSRLVADAGIVGAATPRVLRSFVSEGNTVIDQATHLFIQASPTASFVHIREYTLTVTGTWALAQDSNWIPFVTTAGVLTVTNTGTDLQGNLNWTLSGGDGVKMLEVIAANANKQVSSANAGNIIYTNLMSESGQELQAGQVVQYRVDLPGFGTRAAWQLLVFSGEADVYAWRPRYSQYPNYVSADPVISNSVTLLDLNFYVEEAGTHIVEVHAYSNTTTYRLVPASAPGSNLTSIAATQRHGALAHVSSASFSMLTTLNTLLKNPANRVQLHRPNPTLNPLPESPVTRTIPVGGGALPPAPTVKFYVYLPLVRR